MQAPLVQAHFPMTQTHWLQSMDFVIPLLQLGKGVGLSFLIPNIVVSFSSSGTASFPAVVFLASVLSHFRFEQKKAPSTQTQALLQGILFVSPSVHSSESNHQALLIKLDSLLPQCNFNKLYLHFHTRLRILHLCHPHPKIL